MSSYQQNESFKIFPMVSGILFLCDWLLNVQPKQKHSCCSEALEQSQCLSLL